MTRARELSKLANTNVLNVSGTNVGIGTSSPSQLLQVQKDQAAATFARIDNQSSSSSAYAGVQLGAYGNTWGLAVGSSSANSNALVFVLDPNTSISGGEKMRLDSSGRLGLGTTIPQATLNVAGQIRIDNNTTDLNDGAAYLFQQGGVGWNVASTNIAFTTGSSGSRSERVRIDSSGRLLVGTSTSALEKLVVLGDGGGIQINRNQTGSPTSGQALGSIGFKGVVSANSNAAAEVLIQAYADENHSGSTAGSRLEFHTKASGVGPGSAPTERMRIGSDGKFMVGTTSTGSDRVTFASAGASFNQLALVSTDDASGNGYIQFRNSAGTAIANITRVGTTNAVAYNTTSDYRLKTVTGAVTGQGARIDALKPIDYLWKENGDKARGFLAHEFREVYASSVTGEKDAVDADGNPVYQAMQASTPEIMADLVAEIQSLRARLATLEAA